MRLAPLGRRCAALLATGAVLATGVAATAPAALASTTGNGGVTVGWQPDGNDLGNLTFYDASGHQITSGSTTVAPMAAYYVASASGATSGQIAYSTPVQGANSGTWSGTQPVTSTQTFPQTGLPGDLTGFTGAVVKGATSDGDFDTVQVQSFPNYGTTSTTNPNNNGAGFLNLYEVRMNVNGVTSKWYAADILVDQNAHTWTQVFPNQTTPTVTVSSAEASPVSNGTQVHLTATLSSALPGTVQFLDGSSAVGAPVAVSGSTASTTDTPAVGSHSYTARFTPQPGSVGLSSTSGAYALTVTQPVPPSAPTGLAATPASTALQLSWTAPADGGSPITGYQVTSTPAGGSPSTVSTGSSSPGYRLTGLTNGTSYTVTVAAVNSVGTSPASNAVTATPNPQAPTVPTSVTAVARNGAAAVSFAAPASDGGSPITDYTVTASTGQVVTGTGSPIVVTGLANGTARTFTVKATNAYGTSPASAASNAVVYYSSALSIHANTGVVVAGSTVHLYGQLVSGPASSRRLVLYSYPAGHAATATAFYTSSTGTYSLYVRPAFNTYYKVGYAGDAIHQAVSSSLLRVLARTKVVITSPKSGTRTTTRTLTLTGATYPLKAGVYITLYEHRSTGWVKLAVVKTTSKGTFAFRRTYTKGTHVLQVRIGATSTNAAGSSALCYLYEV